MAEQELMSLVDQALQYATEEVVSAMEEDSEILQKGQLLKNQAIIFLRSIPYSLLEDTTRLEKRIKRLQQVVQGEYNEENVMDAVAEARQSILDDIDMKQYTAAKLLFQKQLNEFIGQKVVTKYVYSNARTKEITLVEIDSNLALEQDKYRGTMRYTNMPYIRKQKEIQQAALTAKEAANEIAAGALKDTYFEVLTRGRKTKRRMLQKAGMGGSFIVFWENEGKWETMRVSSEGDINEAYANFYLNKKYFYFKKAIERDINTYMLDKNYGVIAVDNISGLLQGDVNVDNIAYAIKSRGASMFGDVDIIVTAATLAGMSPGQITKEALIKIRESFKPEHPEQEKARQKLNEALTQTADDILTDLIKEISKNPSMKVSKNWSIKT